MKPYNEQQTKKEQVEAMFDNIAPNYDRLNHILSFQIDRIWRSRVVRIVRRLKPRRVLDVATGTGDLAILLARKIEGAKIVGVDLSGEMLNVARRKVESAELNDRISLEKGDAEGLTTIATESVDVATVAFGVRNFEDLEGGLREMYRAIRRGGKIVVLEFSTPRNRLVRWVYAQYSHHLRPANGGLISKDKQAYIYLPESVDEFPSPERFSEILEGVGFSDVKRRSQSFGIAHIYEATK
jgi:demethylmenaquinone methyltransferase/2-methoxy-6-polyprenyl-1,4-benzoquinol methylase